MLCVALLAPVLWRASMESSLWMDELFSLLLTTHPVRRMIDLAAVDFNPPGYYLILRAWLDLGRVSSGEPGLLWARSLHVLAWTGLFALTWWVGRRRFERSVALLHTLAVCGGAYAFHMATELRGYALGFFAVTAAWLLILALDRFPDGDGRWRVWGAYALCAVVGLWSHLLVAPLVAIFLAWMAISKGIRTGAWKRLLVSHLLLAVAFLPWLLEAPSQWRRLESAAPQWMTTPSLTNLFKVFTVWYPLGPVGPLEGLPAIPLVLLGLLSWTVPVALALLLARWRRPDEPRFRARLGKAPDAATASLLIPAAFVLLLWSLDRAELAHVFHGPRHPALAAGIWSSGLVLVTDRALARGGAARSWAWAALLPWLAATVLGQILALRQESRGGLESALRAEVSSSEEERPVVVMPSQLLPFHRRTLAPYRPRPLDELPRVLLETGKVTVLDLNPWPILDHADALVARHLMARGALSREVEETALTTGGATYRLVRLSGARRERLLREDLLRRRLPTPGAVAAAAPEAQLYRDGWSYPEVGDDGTLYRWGARSPARVRFDRTVPAGRYTLHFDGYRSPSPRPTAQMRWRVDGEEWSHSRAVGEGAFDLRMPLRLEHAHRSLVLEVEHPTWSPAKHGGRDERRLTFALFMAWLVPEG